ncbi:type I phosphomannose isomerase catalytic subunit [Mesomycoplasma dispar]|uniref:Mannose-6-phosphate isomerase n=1 Tax=Mesomycoplasma dispar TaxID=86660 RepID=A0ABM6PRI6_9BACT|nr:type I phosphomannose isomerase catalytic subunit [Mesomycoplasma dispar]ATP59794.1 mannose-6-phosphate isomerase [Mesomycoplasma dispar]
MKNKIFFLKPYQKETLWAGKNLQNHLKSDKKIGELWLISAQENAESIIDSIPLSEFYKRNPDFFSNYHAKVYPNLHKIIDAGQKLSLQVHPDNEIAAEFNSLGKDEAWFVLNSNQNPFLIGVKSLNFTNEISKINLKNIENYSNFYKLEKNDFVYINAGIVHSIPENSLVYEIQQNSDLTFRIYDFDRLDHTGKKRELHLDLAKRAIKTGIIPKIVKKTDEKQQVLVQNSFFNLKRVKISKTFSLNPDPIVFWFEIIIIEGQGTISGIEFQVFDAILVSGKIIEPIIFKAENATILINKVK